MTTQTHETSVFDVAEYIQEKLPSCTPMERHKLAYYAQGWHVTWEGVPLFPERIEAWEHGPVVKALWIAETYGHERAVTPLPERARRVVDAVLAFYGGFSAAQLRAMTHMEAPWTTARRGLPEGAKSREEIPVGDMRRYFTRRSVLREPTPERPVMDTEVSVDETVRVAREQIVRWREALDKLA